MTKQELISHLLSLSRSLKNLADMLQNLPDADITDAWQPPTEISAEIIIDEIKEPEINITKDEENLTADTQADQKHEQPNEQPNDKPQASSQPSPQPPFNPLAQLFGGLKLPNMPNINTSAPNPLNLLNMLGGNPLGNLGGLMNPAGLAGLGSKSGLNLPTTLTELHDNPQILNMVNQVAANPQSLSMLSQLTGQNPQQLQTMLQALNPAPTAATETVNNAVAETAAPSSLNDISGLISGLGNLLGGNLNQQPAVNPPNPVNNLPTNAAVISNNTAMQAMPVTPATAHLDNLLAQWHWQPYARVWKM